METGHCGLGGYVQRLVYPLCTGGLPDNAGADHKGCRGEAKSDEEPDGYWRGTAEVEALGVTVTADVHLSALGCGPADRPCQHLRELGQGNGERQQGTAANAVSGVGKRP